MQAVTPLLGYPVKVPVGPLVGLLSPWLVPYWAPPPSDQLSVSDCWWSCSAICWHGSGPLPQATNCQWVTVGGPAQSLVGQWAPLPSDQLSVSDCWWSCSAIGWHGSGSLPQAANCQWVTVGGPAQSLVGQWAPPPSDQLSVRYCWWSCSVIGWSVGPSPKRPTVSEWPLVVLLSYWLVSGPLPQETNCQWATVSWFIQPTVSGVVVVRLSEVRGRSHSSPRSPSAHPLVSGPGLAVAAVNLSTIPASVA